MNSLLIRLWLILILDRKAKAYLHAMPPRHAPPDSQAYKDPPLPHPAEDLSADDDLLSWVLVDQLGAMPNTKLGVHPQQVKFTGPVFKADEVLNIVKEVREIYV